MNKQPRRYDDDDGRIICSMDVDGMHGHGKTALHQPSETRTLTTGERITRSEARRYACYAVRAGLLVAAVFSLGLVLFTLFCTQVWFR